MFKKIIKLPFLIFIYPILLVLSLLWENIYRFRRFCYNSGLFYQYKFRVPIISVGNLTFGGTGKTPFTLWLADYFGSQKKTVMILMRGYKGTLEGSHGILKTGRKLGNNPLKYGDEALLYAKKLTNASVVVGKHRSENLLKYFNQELPDVVLLDDGHQHLKLARNLNILLFDATLPLERYKTAPLGYMREGPYALKDADLIILGRVNQTTDEKRKELKNFIKEYLEESIPIAEIIYAPRGVYRVCDQEMLPLHMLKGMKMICVAGVASPESFFEFMRVLGAEVLHTFTYPDHHYFSADDSSEILNMACELNANIMTTEKDMVKLKRVINDERLYYLEISVQFITGEKEARELIAKAFLNSH